MRAYTGMNDKLEVKHYRLQLPGIRYLNRQPPLWMKMNIWNKKCWCGGEIIKPQRKYCCFDHSQLWFYSIRGYWAGVRYGVIRLHNFTCVECGFHSKNDSDFDVDHIVAIVNGGMMYDIDNLRPLCRPCHKKKTAKDIKEKTMRKKGLQSIEGFFE